MLDELANVWHECSEPGWDGNGALPVARETVTAADQLLDSLPDGFPKPSIGAEPDGQLTLEWRTSANRVLSVSVDPDGYLHYAGQFGDERQYGTMAYSATASVELLQLIRTL